MKHLLWSRVLAIAALFFSGLQVAAGQWSVHLMNQPVLMFHPAEIPAEMVNEAPCFAYRQFWILQYPEPRNAQKQNELQLAGAVSGMWLGAGCQVVSLPKGFLLSSLSDYGIVGIAPYSIRLIQGFYRAEPQNRFASAPLAHLQVLPHKGLKPEYIHQNWKPTWGTLEAVWPGKLTKWIVRCTAPQVDSLVHSGWVQWMEPADGELIPLNGDAAGHARTNTLKTAGFGWTEGLDGSGVSIAVGDGGMVTSHSDLESHQENLTPNKIPSFGNHQDHVTGTVAGQGLIRSDGEGMAPRARVLNAQTSFVISNGSALNLTEKVVLTNNSYGVTYNCNRAGNYTATSAYIDDQLTAHPDLLHVFAAGNQGYVSCSPYPTGFKTIADGYPVSKNVLTVGATLSKDEFAWFSSAGPAGDGRIKPEIVVNGNDILSTVPTEQYEKKSGTSMASPVVTGTLALLVQRYRQLYSGQNPESALLKGLLCNTAEDLGLPNVDFTYGFGRLNARRARQALENQWFKEGTLVSNTSSTISIPSPGGARKLKVMLVWADAAGYPGADHALVNDLNLSVVSGGSTVLPWVMNHLPSNVSQPAIRGIDTLNNVEQATLDIAENQMVHIHVSAKTLGGAQQKFWVVYDWISPELVLTTPANHQTISSGCLLPIRWDINELNLTNLRLETSTDGGQSWSTAVSISEPDSLYTEWNVPSIAFRLYHIRLSAESGTQTITSNVVTLLASEAPVVLVDACDHTLRLRWEPVPSTTKYEVFVLDREAGKWKTKGFTIANCFVVNQLENGKVWAVAVKAWKGSVSSVLSKTVFGVPQPGACPWNSDLALSELIAPQSGRRHTSTDPGVDGTLRIEIQNVGNEAINGQACRVYYKAPTGVVSYTDLLVSLAPNSAKEVTLPWSLNLAQAGEYPVRFWLQNTADPNPGNDTLMKYVKIISNEPVTLPWSMDAEAFLSGEDRSTTGLKGYPEVDFYSVASARVLPTMPAQPIGFGAHSLVLDKKKTDGTVGNGALVFTLNLSNYPGAGRLYLDFDFLAFGVVATGNNLEVRANDMANWTTVLRFSEESFVHGQVKKYRVLDLAPFLNGQTLSPSFQIRFTQSGLKPSTTINGEGYAIDNLVLSFPTNDFSVGQFLAPLNGCQDNTPRRVKIRIHNFAPQPHANIKVGYSIAGGTPVEEEIASIDALDSLDYEFATILDQSIIGKLNFKIWVRVPDDGYPGNDTLPNQVVFIAPNISVYPYYEGFEEGHGHWETYGVRNSWGWGSPSKGLHIVDSAANGTRIWGTGLSSPYTVDQLSYLQSPCFNLSDIQGDVQFSFNSVFSMEQDYDYAWLEMSEDGEHWIKIGAKGNGTNWYTHASDQWNGISPHWQVSSIAISPAGLTDRSKVRFRFGFSSDASVVSEGFGLDDIHLEPAFRIISDTSYSEVLLQQMQLEWNEFGPRPHKIVSISNAEMLGDIGLKMRKNTGMIRYHDNVPYLDRNFVITPQIQPTGKVKVRLYVTDPEVKALALADASMTSFQQLGIHKYHGANEDLEIDNNLKTSNSELFIPAEEVQKVPTAGGYYLEFSVESFSEFYVATQSLSGPDNPLAVEMLSFTARRETNGKAVKLAWETASERDADRFELEYSCDGRFFEKVKVVPAQGSVYGNQTYQVLHQPKPCNRNLLLYRLLQYDHGAKTPSIFTASCANMGEWESAIWVENPVGDNFHVSGISEPSHLILTDGLGRILVEQDIETEEKMLDASKLPSGSYWLRITSASGQKRFAVVKH